MTKRKKRAEKGKILHRCPYAEGCRLPLNNNVYWWHIGFLIVCWFVLCLDTNQLTPFSILMFVVPNFIDLTRTGVANKREKIIKGILVGISALFVIVSFVLLRPEIKITPFAIAIPTTSAIFAGLLISKALFAKALCIEILIPVYLLFTTPTKEFQAHTNGASEG